MQNRKMRFKVIHSLY